MTILYMRMHQRRSIENTSAQQTKPCNVDAPSITASRLQMSSRGDHAPMGAHNLTRAVGEHVYTSTQPNPTSHPKSESRSGTGETRGRHRHTAHDERSGPPSDVARGIRYDKPLRAGGRLS
ncbi:hypothetical protein P154DRAFT_625084 [Amniculicola lignicola CBS 123094]|uniref:Uncharacterized protein n=1 Tax=Amniculicola lignicola CBS 123094 TaxID=1392246 RepID=A0A6A5VYX4_9PLEO|nr:hypothetical protein P154DRAFT_625084 [Amniculicola lignicola CBS 123094]